MEPGNVYESLKHGAYGSTACVPVWGVPKLESGEGADLENDFLQMMCMLSSVIVVQKGLNCPDQVTLWFSNVQLSLMFESKIRVPCGSFEVRIGPTYSHEQWSKMFPQEALDHLLPPTHRRFLDPKFNPLSESFDPAIIYPSTELEDPQIPTVHQSATGSAAGSSSSSALGNAQQTPVSTIRAPPPLATSPTHQPPVHPPGISQPFNSGIVATGTSSAPRDASSASVHRNSGPHGSRTPLPPSLPQAQPVPPECAVPAVREDTASIDAVSGRGDPGFMFPPAYLGIDRVHFSLGKVVVFPALPLSNQRLFDALMTISDAAWKRVKPAFCKVVGLGCKLPKGVTARHHTGPLRIEIQDSRHDPAIIEETYREVRRGFERAKQNL